jgi:putative transposase
MGTLRISGTTARIFEVPDRDPAGSLGSMPRGPRAIHPGVCYHVINRGNHRRRLFHRAADYAAFVTLIQKARDLVPIDLFAVCLMPNHFHVVLRAAEPDAVGRWMHWLLTNHAQRYNRYHGLVGRVWQGRYKAFPIERDDHLLSVLRYVECNAVRAHLVRRARDWHWGSASWRRGPSSRKALLAEPPIALPRDWDDLVEQPLQSTEVEQLRACVNRQQPYGSDAWIDGSGECSGFRRARPRGRPPCRK